MKETPPPILKIPLRNGRSFDMIFVEGGEFLMGAEKSQYDDERPVHQVKVSGFYIGKFPVTQHLWQSITGENPSRFKGENRPVEMVSWHDAQGFIEKLNAALSLPQAIRLPTEAEWEFAARGGNKSGKYGYAGSDKLKEVGWYSENSYGETKPVGLKFPNELGLSDMSGNVWEWCQDWYDSDYYKKCASEGLSVNPQGPERGVYRVLRGGGYFYSAGDCRSTYRSFRHPDYQFSGIGFRLVVPSQSVG
ncbi:MAG: formylglycine-generating enzyme family protein [Saprospiraceae bacterium]